MNVQHHHIKILPEYFRAIASGEKTFEVRFNDWNYHIHDILHLQENGRMMNIQVRRWL